VLSAFSRRPRQRRRTSADGVKMHIAFTGDVAAPNVAFGFQADINGMFALPLKAHISLATVRSDPAGAVGRGRSRTPAMIYLGRKNSIPMSRRQPSNNKGRNVGWDRFVPAEVLQPQLITAQDLAEREGFEPPIRLPVCRISSAVHSTALPPLRKPKRA
jgi:hypothetical protein